MIQLNLIIQLYDQSFFSPGCFGDFGFLCIRNLQINNFLNKLAKNLNKPGVFIYFFNLMYKILTIRGWKQNVCVPVTDFVAVLFQDVPVPTHFEEEAIGIL